ncbi:MAG: flippase-like domain-containing protein, partial [Deltaproteobacteria bacterium]|nr:flippase-like domain-containing protein [Deltaproteobacteria bacterium]
MALTKKLVLNLMKAAVTLGILLYLYKKGMLDLTRVRAVLTSPSVVATSLTLLFSTNLAGVVRWWLLLQGQKLKMAKWETFQLTMIGVFFNTAIPGAVSGDLVKGFYVVRQQPDGRGKIKAFTTLLLDRVLGLSALVCVSFVAMVSNATEVLHNPMTRPLAGLITMLWAGVVVFYAFVL